jgi:hypothetical protein
MKWNMQELRRPRTSTRRQPIRKHRPQVERLETRLAPANVAILRGHNDNLLSGSNNQETALNPSTVNDAGFGRLFNAPVDGYTYAQPLYVPNLTIAGGTHNVVFAATEHDSVYAFDADTGAPLWAGGKRSFIDPANGITSVPQPDVLSGDIVPEIGITGTPVIDGTTMYVVAKTKELRTGDPNPHYVQKLYAIDITTGLNRATAGVVTIGDTTFVGGVYTDTTPISVPGTGAGSSGGVVRFNALRESNRPALQIVTNADSTKTVYVTYASHGDNGPYHGWVLGYGASDLSVQKVFNSAPNGSASGIWESGGNLGVDAQNNLYFSTGNGFGTGFDGNGGPRALGATGGALGYGGNGTNFEQRGVTNSFAVAFRAFDHSSTSALSTNATGTTSTVASFDLGGGTGIDFNAGAQATPRHVFRATLAYNDTTHVLTETIQDLTVPATVTETYNNVDIPTLVGGSTAWVGFTAGTGGLNAQQDIQTWTYTPTTGTGIDHSAGFASNADLLANGVGLFSGTAARLTIPQNNGAGSVFSVAKVNVAGFSTTFTFQLSAGSSPSIADGFTFTIQNKPQGTSYSESVLKLSTTTGTGTALPVVDSFTPNDWKNLDNNDADLGSGGTMLLPDAVGSTAHPHLIIEAGKTGRMYLIDRDRMGENVPAGSADQVLQTITLGGPGVWGNPAFFQDGANTGVIYYWGSTAPGVAYRITNGVINTTPLTTTGSFQFGFPGSQPSISSNGMDANSAIAWFMRVDNFGSQGAEQLFAYRAENFTSPIWTSNDVLNRDGSGTSVKFTFPIVTNGHVYVGTSGFLTAYGLLPAHSTPPAIPANFQVSQVPPDQGGSTKLLLSWNATPDATLIKIERSTAGAGGPFTQIAQVGPNLTGPASYTDSGLMPVTHYWYRIRATNQAGDSGYTAVADQFTRLASSVVSIVGFSSGSVSLSWTNVANDHYAVERSQDPNPTNFIVVAPNIPAGTTTYTDTTVTRPNVYHYRIRAFNVNPTDQSVSNVADVSVGPLNINFPFPAGITSSINLNGNGSAQLLTGATQEHLFRLNDNFSQAGSVFTTTKIDDTKFSSTFWVRLHEGTQPNPADGFTFTLQNNSPSALGGGGGALGYQGIGRSVAIKFDVFENEGETNNSTGLFFNGDFPGVPHSPGEVNVPLDPNVVNLRDQDRKRIDINYDLTTLTLTVMITDEIVVPQRSVMQTYHVNIPAIIGSTNAYVGFTGGTGGLYSIQDILGWVLSPTKPLTPTNVQVASTTATTATLTWTANSADEDGFRIDRSFDNFHWTQAGQVGPGVLTFTDTPPTAPGLWFYRVHAFNMVGDSDFSNGPANPLFANLGRSAVSVDHSQGFTTHTDLQSNGSTTFVPSGLGSLFNNQDIGTSGNPTAAGSTTFASGTGTYTLQASGSDIWDTADHFQYSYRPLTGDGEVVARVASVSPSDFWTKAGVMIRDNLSAGSPNAFMFETPHGTPGGDHDEPVFQWRDTQGGGSADFDNHINGIQQAPVWVRLVRTGQSFSGFWAHDNGDGTHGTWNQIGSAHTITAMGSTVYVGLALTEHNNQTTLATATFDHLTITQGTTTLPAAGLLRVTDGGGGQASSVYKTQQVPVTGTFATSFVLKDRPVSLGGADGLTFVLQADPRGASALGGGGGSLGYEGITPSVAVMFDLWTGGSHTSNTKLLINGSVDRTGAVSMLPNVNLLSNDPIKVDLTYDGYTLFETVRDLSTGGTFSTSYLVNIRQIIGRDTAFVGFTGATGGASAVQDIQNWTSDFEPFVPPAHYLVAGFPASPRAGSVNTFNVQVKDFRGNTFADYPNTVHFTSTDPRAILPDDYTFTAADAGSKTFGAVLFTAGQQSITATETADTRVTELQSNIMVRPLAASSLVLALPPSVGSGTQQNFTVTAKDIYGNTATGYTGTVSFTSTDPAASLPGPYHFTTGPGGDNGTHTFSFSLGTLGTQSVSVTDGTFSDTESTVVTPARFLVNGYPTPVTAGSAGTFMVTAQNADGSTATGYTGTVHFTSTDGQANLPDDYTFTTGDQGTHIFGAVLKTAGTQSITATDASFSSLTGSQNGIQVIPSDEAGFFVVNGFPSPIQAGTPGSVTVTVYDPFGNLATGYHGTITFSSTDNRAVLPSDYTFTGSESGTHTFAGIVLETAGTQSIAVTDTGNGATGSQDGIVVTPSVAVALQVLGYPSPTMAGDVHTFIVTAVDAFGNTGAIYTGTVHFTSSDDLANLPADTMFTPEDQGTRIFSAVFNTVGTQSITATDTVDGTITGTQDGIEVVAGPSIPGRGRGPGGEAFLVGPLAPAAPAQPSNLLPGSGRPALVLPAGINYEGLDRFFTAVTTADGHRLALRGLSQDTWGAADATIRALGLALRDSGYLVPDAVIDDLIHARTV